VKANSGREQANIDLYRTRIAFISILVFSALLSFLLCVSAYKGLG